MRVLIVEHGWQRKALGAANARESMSFVERGSHWSKRRIPDVRRRRKTADNRDRRRLQRGQQPAERLGGAQPLVAPANGLIELTPLLSLLVAGGRGHRPGAAAGAGLSVFRRHGASFASAAMNTRKSSGVTGSGSAVGSRACGSSAFRCYARWARRDRPGARCHRPCLAACACQKPWEASLRR